MYADAHILVLFIYHFLFFTFSLTCSPQRSLGHVVVPDLEHRSSVSAERRLHVLSQRLYSVALHSSIENKRIRYSAVTAEHGQARWHAKPFMS